MIARARAKAQGVHAHLRFITAAVEDLSPEVLGWFDLVLLIGSLEHMLNPARALTRVSAALAPSGEAVVIMRNPVHPSVLAGRFSRRSWALPRYPHLAPRELAKAAQLCGLKVVRLTPVVAAFRAAGPPSSAPACGHSPLGVWWHRTYAAHLMQRQALSET